MGGDCVIRRSIKKVARAFGYELSRPGFQEPLPWTIENQGETTLDIEGDRLPLLANRTYEPPKMSYVRSRFGDDHRLKYILYYLDLRDLRVLEVGPSFGHNSIVLEKLGIAENVAVEGRDVNFQKCLRVKELYGLDRTTYVLHDIERLASGEEQPNFSGQFDLVFCLGLLYHLADPGPALAWFRSQSPTLFLGTHYVETAEPRGYPQGVFDEMKYVYREKDYRAMRWIDGGLANPLGGLGPYSVWPYEEDLIRLVRDAGYSRVDVLGKDLQAGAPHMTMLARA